MSVINIRDLPDDTRAALLRYHLVVSNEYQQPLVYIGRPSKWGNPYVVGGEFTREDVVALYREDVETGWPPYDDLEELRGKVLVCWCAPKACHGDVLAEFANA